ncbi:MAG: CoA transferase [Dehalococcoidales bacterium]|nr:CoA transferase [Dehalococcoidales bacterium]
MNGIRIIDFSWVLAGPFCTRLLADFGAQVIKIQPPMPEESGAFNRGYYNNWNRNKLGVRLNLNKPKGIELVKRLVQISDVVIENFSPRVIENWGLGYPELQKINPRIIMVSLSLMGHSGPWRDYTGFGPGAQAFSGITHMTAYPGKPPSGIGFSLADHVAALYASLSILGALEYRRRTGQGQYIDISLTEAVCTLLYDEILNYTLNGDAPVPEGNSSPKYAPHGIYRCRGKDRWCAIAVTSEEEWQRFKQVLDYPEWAEDSCFASMESRVQNRQALDEFVQRWTSNLEAEDVMSLLQSRGIPAGVVQNAADLADDPQLNYRDFFIHIEHPLLGETRADACPLKFSFSPAEYLRSAPDIGQDNDYVFRELLGISDSELNRLKENDVI